ncbi:MAG: hypothetical protein K8T20_03455 [Planctomycetes bacterium]|nr:hypothetical protein [Planctomycetota bacterium]
MPRSLAALALFVSLATAASAEESRPDVSQNAWLDLDVASLKAGDWVKRRLEQDGEKPVEYRLACVGVEADVVWIEEDRTTAEFFPGTVILCSVGLKDRLVKRVFWGKPGEKGKELTPTRASVPDPGNDAASGTAEVTVGKVKIKDKEFVTEKVEIKTEAEGFGAPVKVKQVLVFAPGVPFGLYADDKGVCRASIQEGKIEWKGKATWKGGLVSMVMEAGTKTALTLLEWGTDAKATLLKP